MISLKARRTFRAILESKDVGLPYINPDYKGDCLSKVKTYKISRSVCNEQQLEHKMYVVDIRTLCIYEEISYVPIWKECMKIKFCLHKCIFVKRNVKKIKYIVTITDIRRKQIIYLMIMHLPMSIIMRDLGTCINVHHSS